MREGDREGGREGREKVEEGAIDVVSTLAWTDEGLLCSLSHCSPLQDSRSFSLLSPSCSSPRPSSPPSWLWQEYGPGPSARSIVAAIGASPASDGIDGAPVPRIRAGDRRGREGGKGTESGGTLKFGTFKLMLMAFSLHEQRELPLAYLMYRLSEACLRGTDNSGEEGRESREEFILAEAPWLLR